MMDLDELRSVQSRERQTDSLQQLRETFYQDVGAFIESLRAERERAADEADDPWNSPEVGRLSDDIETAEQTVEAIYERRVGKIVKMASLAAADMPTEDDGLTEEEERLFDALVSQIENNRTHVEAVLDGDSPPPSNATDGSPEPETSATETPTPAGEDAHASAESTAGVDAADLMGAGPDDGESPPPNPQEGSEQVEDDTSTSSPRGPHAEEGPGAQESHTETGHGSTSTSQSTEHDSSPNRSEGQRVPNVPKESESTDGVSEPPAESASEDSGVENPDVNGRERPTQTTDGGTAVSASSTEDGSAGVERTTVRITDDVGEIFGVDQRSYDLSSEDVVTLPEQNATPLLDSDAAERLE